MAIQAKPKKRGRPATGRDPMMGFRAAPALRASIVRWAENQIDNPSLSEATRRLVEIAIKAESPTRPSREITGASRAAELATKAIEKIADPTNAISADGGSPRARKSFARIASICPNGRDSRRAGRKETMSKKPKIDHEYHAGKDKMKITIEGYSPSKKSRDAIMKKLMAQLESSPDRSVAKFEKKPKKASGKERRGVPKESKLIEIGD